MYYTDVLRYDNINVFGKNNITILIPMKDKLQEIFCSIDGQTV